VGRTPESAGDPQVPPKADLGGQVDNRLITCPICFPWAQWQATKSDRLPHPECPNSSSLTDSSQTHFPIHAAGSAYAYEIGDFAQKIGNIFRLDEDPAALVQIRVSFRGH
jgi:hypothetical protein